MFVAISHLDTFGSWPMHNRMDSELMRRPQQGSVNSSRMKAPRCMMTPTRSRFLAPNVCTATQMV